MADSADLIGLLHQIRGAARPLDRLRLATLAWRTLRSLGPVERMAVAKALGVEGAERLVEQLGSTRGISPSALMTAIHRAEDADPEELRRLFAQLRDPETRTEAAAEVLGDVEEWLVEEADHVRTVGPTEEPRHGADQSLPPIPELPTVPQVAPPNALQPQGHAPAPDEPASGGGPPRLEEARLDPSHAEPPASNVRSTPDVRSEPAGVVPPRWPPRRPARQPTPTTSATPPTSSAPTLLDRLAVAETDLQRLRLLDRHPRELRRLSRAELERVAELLPEGWRRRRALEAMVRAGTPTPDLLALLAAVENPGVAAWVLATLAERGDLDVDEVAGGSPSLQRRLRLRRQRCAHR